METRELFVNKALKKVSLLGFGCMRFPMKNGEVDLETSEQMIDYAYQKGVNYFDTAWPYHNGQSEVILGNILKKYPRDSFFLADKLPLWEIETLVEAKVLFEKQLEKTQTNYFDFYLIHAVNKERYQKTIDLKILPWLEELRQEGKIKNIGFSFHDDYKTFTKWLNLYPWDFCQIQLNYMDINHQQGIKGYFDLTKKNIPVIVMEPVKGGALAKFHPSVEELLYDLDKTKSIASWAFRYVASLDNVKVILSGMSEPSQVQDNIITFSPFVALTDLEQTRIAEVREALINLTEVDCTKCNYCMPCPNGVDIPGNFALFNTHKMYQNDDAFRKQMNRFQEEEKDATVCTTCGDCLDLCPQNILIPDELSRLTSYMKDNGLE